MFWDSGNTIFMSGIEAIGALASISQVAVYTLKVAISILEIYNRVQDYPQEIEENIQQLERLIGIAEFVE